MTPRARNVRNVQRGNARGIHVIVTMRDDDDDGNNRVEWNRPSPIQFLRRFVLKRDGPCLSLSCRPFNIMAIIVY